MWGAGVVLAADFLFGSFDWNAHHVNVNYDHFHDGGTHHGGVAPWEHNPKHRQGVEYRQPGPHAPLTAPLALPPERREYRGFQAAPVPPAAPVAPMARPFGRTVVPPARQPLAPKPHAFENIDQGRAVRDFSARGQNSVRSGAPPRDSRCPPGGCTSDAVQPRDAPQGGRLIRKH